MTELDHLTLIRDCLQAKIIILEWMWLRLCEEAQSKVGSPQEADQAELDLLDAKVDLADAEIELLKETEGKT
jgi:hypothetical protein